VKTCFRLERGAAEPRRLDIFGASAGVASRGPVHAMAGVARPERFFAELRAAGWDVKGSTAFADHHRYSARDLAVVVAAARSEGARAIITTEKDTMRILPFRPLPLPLIWVPLDVRIEPDRAFRDWLGGRLAAGRSAAEGGRP
jgi:tetraacyldisaccharide 4'-kinase